MRTPLATYRLQLNGAFPLARARALVPYLRRLGVTHVYSSPLLRARRGSTHGYDVVDPTRLNPELGDDVELRALCRALSRARMGLVLDVVPNHMAASAENPFWDDVLAHGRASRFAGWFDIDWQAGDGRTRGRVLLPVLAGPFARELAAGRLELVREGARLRVRYHDQSFPLDPASLPLVFQLAGRRGRVAPAGVSGSADDRHRRAPDPELERVLAALRSLPPRDEGAAVAARRHAASGRALAALEALLDRSAGAGAGLDRAVASFRGGAGAARLRGLLEAQPYALVHWRRATAEVNYRRFFDINDLVGLRTEDPAVFAATHARLLAWVADGRLDGLRIDHVDGMRDPLGYLRRLRAAVDERSGKPPLEWPIVVEKILSPGERLPSRWPVAGTTGYEFLSRLEAALLDPDGFLAIETAYRVMVGRTHGFAEAARRGKRQALLELLATDVQRVALRLRRCARRDPATAGLGLAELSRAVVETIVHLPVYRTYVDGRPGSPRDADRRLIEGAVEGARARGRARPEALELVARLLLSAPCREADPDAEHDRLAFAERLQQLSGPAAAKGVEDTALYVYVPLVSRNEVGGDPGAPPADAVRALHAANLERARRWPRSLLCTTTHDTKRSADVRARLDVLSEVPGEWRERVRRWGRWNRPHRRAAAGRLLPDANSEYLLYQTLVGIWPLPGGGDAWEAFPHEDALADLRERVRIYARKAAREAREHTSWTDPDTAFEEALDEFVSKLLTRAAAGWFLDDLAEFARRVSRPGLWNALSRTLVHLTAPGVPDLYQGDELWSFALVDPDNRRPVDFELSARLLADLERRFGRDTESRRALLSEMVAAPQDGRLKLHVVRSALSARARLPGLFLSGGYRPLRGSGAGADHLLVFARIARGRAAITVAPRLSATLPTGFSGAPVGEAAWGDSFIPLPPGLARLAWRDTLTWETLRPTRRAGHAGLPVARLLRELPVALLIAT